MRKQPFDSGWYWYLPDPNGSAKIGLLQQRQPVVVLVGVGSRGRLVCRFGPGKTILCTDMPGWWARIEPPQEMKDLRNQIAKQESEVRDE